MIRIFFILMLAMFFCGCYALKSSEKSDFAKWELQLSLSLDAYELLDMDLHLEMAKMNVSTKRGIKSGTVDIVISSLNVEQLEGLRERLNATGYDTWRLFKNGQEQ